MPTLKHYQTCFVCFALKSKGGGFPAQQESSYICHHHHLWRCFYHQHRSCQPAGIEEGGRPHSAPRARLLPSKLSLLFSRPRCGSPKLFVRQLKKSSPCNKRNFCHHLSSSISCSLSLSGHHSLHFSSETHILDFHPGMGMTDALLAAL